MDRDEFIRWKDCVAYAMGCGGCLLIVVGGLLTLAIVGLLLI